MVNPMPVPCILWISEFLESFWGKSCAPECLTQLKSLVFPSLPLFAEEESPVSGGKGRSQLGRTN